MADDERDFFRWQHRAMGWLLGWGSASVVGGAALSSSRQALLRHIGLQALGWGTVDALLALNGRRGARANLARLADGRPLPRTAEQERSRFRTIVAANAGLDVLYVVGGLVLAARARRRPDRRGAGLGVALQGLWLLAFDGYLTWRLRDGA